MDSYDEGQAGLANAISKIADDEIITHYVVVAVDIEGCVHTISSPGLPYWMKHGLLSSSAAACLPTPNWVEAVEHDDED